MSLSDSDLTRLILEQADSLFSRTSSGLLAASVTPLTNSIVMAGRRAGKTTMARKWVEDYQEVAVRRPMSPEEFNKEYLGDFSAMVPDEDLAKATGYTVTNMTTAAATPTMSWEQIKALKGKIEEMGILDSVAGAAAGLARNMKGNDMDDTTKKQLQGIGAALMHRNAQAGEQFGLTGPMQLTIKTRQSAYKKKAFLGDETFTLSSHYVGKKEMILVFKNTRPVDYAFMEMPLDEALTNLKGFREFADAAGGGDIHGALANIETIKTQERRAETEVLMQDPEFASW